MIRTSLLALSVISIVCTWCGKDFVSLGRHTWRCRSKINPEDINNNRSSSNKTLGKTTTQPVLQVNEIQCSCGKKCKGHRGLKTHQRSCRVIRGLNADLLEDLDTEIDTWNSTDTSDTSPEILRSIENHVSLTENPYIKQGIKLPNTSREWEIANDFFKFKFLNQQITDENLDLTIEHMNEVIYSYFMQNYGTVNNAHHSSLMCSYKAKSIRELKKELKVLKARKADTVEIKFVTNILRKKLQKTDLTCLESNTVHHDQFIGKIFGDMLKPSLSKKPIQDLHLTRRPAHNFSLICLHVLVQGNSFPFQTGFLHSLRQKFLLTLALLPINRSQMLFVK